MARNCPFIGRAAAFIAATSNAPPVMASRSLMNSGGTRWPMAPKMIATVGWKKARSAQALAAQSAPWITFGEGCSRSISAMITAMSQNTSAPICITGMRR